MLITTTQLTLGERWFIERRRCLLTQVEQASDMDIPLAAYRALEGGTLKFSMPKLKLGKLDPREACTIMRHRKGWSTQDLADRIRVSRYWITRMERGDAPVDTLVAYWYDA